ncbi:MAG: AsmA-like C-terminal region-containing protein [Alphaproteobacteria bacterium]
MATDESQQAPPPSVPPAKARRRLRRIAIIGLEVLAGATLGFMVLMGVTIWRLSEGPIEIDFMSDTIEQALSDPDRGVNVAVGSTLLTWEGWARGLDIHLIDVTVRNGAGDEIAEVGDMSVAFGLRALMRGELAPTRLEVIAPSIRLTYGADGSLTVGHGEATLAPVDGAPSPPPNEEPVLALIVQELMLPPNGERRLGSLRSFQVRDASLIVHDEAHGAVWETPGANLILRRDDSGLNLEAALAVRLDNDVTFFDISAFFDRAARGVRLDVDFDRIRPSLLAAQLPYLADLGDFDLPVSGRVSANLGGEAADIGLRLDVEFADTVGSIAANGRFDLDGKTVTVDAVVTNMALADLATRLPWLTPLAGFHVVADGQAQLVVAENGVQSAGFEFRSGAGTVVMPDRPDMPLAVDSIALQGAMAGAGDALDIGNVDIAFGTTHFTGSASAFADGTGSYDIAVQGALSDVAVADIGRYWPDTIAANARRWIERRVLGGTLDRVDMALYGKLDAEHYAFTPQSTDFDLAFRDVALVYVEGMPPLTGLNGHGRYDGTAMRVEVEPGASTFDLATGPGTMVIDGFDRPLPRATLVASLNGDMRNHFRMLDHEPLGFLAGYGMTPADVRGNAAVELNVGFDVDAVVPLEAIDIDVTARLSGATLPRMVGDKALTGATLAVRADNDAMLIEGSGTVDGTAVDVSRTERFAGGDYASESTLRGVFDAERLADMGLDVRQWVAGPVGFAARYTEYRDSTSRADVALDLGGAAMQLPALVWGKAAGAPASASFGLALRDGNPFAIDRFDVDAGDLAASGRVDFNADGTLRAVELQDLRLGRTQVAGRVEPTANDGLAITLNSGTFDLQPLLEADDDGPDESTRPIAIAATLDKVWLTGDGFVSGVTGTMQLVGSTWVNGRIAASSTSGAPVEVTLDPTENGRFLRVTTNDAGSLLNDLDLVRSVRDGRLVVAARFRDHEPGQPLVGDIDLTDFRLVDAPLLARIVSIAGVTGILDALQGEGIGFGRMLTTFRLADGRIEFREGRMVGPSLGITFDGAVDIDRDQVDLRGAVAPAYAVNGILGEIPLIGDVLVGGEGEGIFAVTYQASGAAGDPQVAVNPLSALTPGVLRNIFPGG